MIDLVQKSSKLILQRQAGFNHTKGNIDFIFETIGNSFFFFKSFKYNALYKKVKKANLFSTGSSHERVKR